jgi:lipopolysaccharide exporter
MNLGARGAVLQGAVWMGAARVVVSLTAFASTIILARLLSPSDFGLVAIATAAVTVLAAFSEL